MKKPFNCTPRNHRGVTLVELIAGLSIIALIIAGALTLYRSADDSQKANQILVNTTGIQQAMKALYQGNYVPSGASFQVDLTTINRWPASATNITAAAANAGTSYTLTVANVNKATCVAVLSAATGWNSVTGLSGTANAGTTLPLTGSAALTACTPAGTATTATLVFAGS